MLSIGSVLQKLTTRRNIVKKIVTAAVLAATVAIAPLTATADAWQNQANSELSFLPQGQVSAGVAGEVQGEGLPLYVLYYMVIAAPTVAKAIQIAVMNHVPGTWASTIWNQING